MPDTNRLKHKTVDFTPDFEPGDRMKRRDRIYRHTIVPGNEILDRELYKLYWKSPEVLKFLGIPKSRLYNWIEYFGIKHYRAGKSFRMRFKRGAVLELLELKRLLLIEGYGFPGAKEKLSQFRKRYDPKYPYVITRDTYELKYGR